MNVRERRGSFTSCLLCPQSVHASLLHSGPEGWREAGATQPPPPAPLPPGRDLWPRGSAVGADGLQRFTATDLLPQRRLLGGRTDTFTDWHSNKRRCDVQMYYLVLYTERQEVKHVSEVQSIMSQDTTDLSASVILLTHVFTRGTFLTSCSK